MAVEGLPDPLLPSLCDEHVVSGLRAFIDGTKEYFGTVRFPSSESSGYYD